MLLFWILLGLLLTVGYIVAYVLLRTSGDGRPAIARLVHPSQGGLQEEYGGRGNGRAPHADDSAQH